MAQYASSGDHPDRRDSCYDAERGDGIDFPVSDYTPEELLDTVTDDFANLCIDPKEPRYRCVVYYRQQTKHTLGDASSRVQVPIWINNASIHRDWFSYLDNAIGQINMAAPGLRLYKTDTERAAKVVVNGTSENKACTIGHIQVSDQVAKITLGHKFEKRQTSVHELMHALGFAHEQKRYDASLSVANCCPRSDRMWYDQYKATTCTSPLTRFDPFSVMLYPEDEWLRRKENSDPVWQLKEKGQTNYELSELDKVGLNLLYPPCKGPNYRPKKSEVTGMWYCGRYVMKHHDYPAEGTTDGRCGPDNWANCPACRYWLWISRYM